MLQALILHQCEIEFVSHGCHRWGLKLYPAVGCTWNLTNPVETDSSKPWHQYWRYPARCHRLIQAEEGRALSRRSWSSAWSCRREQGCYQCQVCRRRGTRGNCSAGDSSSRPPYQPTVTVTSWEQFQKHALL